MKLLFSLKASVTAGAEYPLHVACRYQTLSVIKLLGVDNISSHNNNGDNIFHMACRNEVVTFDLIEYIIEKLNLKQCRFHRRSKPGEESSTSSAL